MNRERLKGRRSEADGEMEEMERRERERWRERVREREGEGVRERVSEIERGSEGEREGVREGVREGGSEKKKRNWPNLSAEALFFQTVLSLSGFRSQWIPDRTDGLFQSMGAVL